MQENNLEQFKEYIGKRISSGDTMGTILFAGNLCHEGRPAGSDDQLWLGIEWDDITRGKHNGTVNNHVYFQTADIQNSGSLIKNEKANFGIIILEGIFQKYFRDNIPQDVKQKIIQQLQQNNTVKSNNSDISLQQQQQQQSQNEQNNQQTTNDELAQKQNDEKQQQQQEQQQQQPKEIPEEKKESAKIFQNILVEYDDNAFFETSKKQKKMVEFYGFDKIWNKLNNMKELQDISLVGVNISNIGEPGYFQSLLPNLKVLSFEGNLLFDWNQVFQIGNELNQLQELSISSNRLRPIESIIGLQTIKCLETNKDINISPVGIFKNLKVLNLINTNMSWKQLCVVLPAFPFVEELILCRNRMTDVQNINLDGNTILQNLVFLNLENTFLETFEGINQHFQLLPKLEKLILNKNFIQELGVVTNFKKLKYISLEGNLIKNPSIFSELSQFQELIYLNIKHNPIADVYGKGYVRQRAVAENAKLEVINGSNLKKYERKDCEIFYMRKTFDDYFQAFNKVYYDYDYEDFKQWAFPQHPRLQFLIKHYGNPYEIQPKNPDNKEGESVAKNIMIKLQIVVAAGPHISKTINKKFPDNTTIASLKNVFSKLFSIASDQQILYYKINPNDPMEILDEDHKALNFYGIKDESELVVDMKQN